eukprot:TRINITY_DN10309_c0_g2_i1.p1 TRINITY_DN10309_c0_g2~~TRINITY_DN10309_c0_g2_i1.p1  ORF type:complete len:632 (+),score=200.76 TRINITY_DN10309_c0_g2_i1:90-1985(+)
MAAVDTNMNVKAVTFVPVPAWSDNRTAWPAPVATGSQNFLNLDQYSDDSSSDDEQTPTAAAAVDKQAVLASKKEVPVMAPAPSLVKQQSEPLAEPDVKKADEKKPAVRSWSDVAKGNVKKDKESRTNTPMLSETVATKTAEQEETTKNVEQEELPQPWYKKESSKYPGRFYYVNRKTKATTWKLSDIVGEVNEKGSSTGESEPEAEASIATQADVTPASTQSKDAAAPSLCVQHLLRWRQLAEPCSEPLLRACSESSLELPAAIPAAEPAKPAPAPAPVAKGGWRAAVAGVKVEKTEGSWRAATATAQSAGVASRTSAAAEPIAVSSDSWAAKMRERRAVAAASSSGASSGSDSEGLNEAQVTRTVKSLLNKLTLEKFESITRQLCDIRYSDAAHVKILIKEVFEKAIMQHSFIDMYADLCELLHEFFLQKPVSADSKSGFKKLLLGECQNSFERNLVPPADLDRLEDEERTIAEVKYKTKMLGNIRFVGALLARGMLAGKVLISILRELMSDPTPEALETVAALLTVTGPAFDNGSWNHADELDDIFDQIEDIVRAKKVGARQRCLLQDVLDLRANDWADAKPKKIEGPMTLQQVAAQAMRENGRNSPQSFRSSSRYSSSSQEWWNNGRW